MTQALTQGPEQVGTGGECGGGGLPMPSAGMAFQSLGEAATGSPHFASERQKQGRGGALSPPPPRSVAAKCKYPCKPGFPPCPGSRILPCYYCSITPSLSQKTETRPGPTRQLNVQPGPWQELCLPQASGGHMPGVC